jgi:hypothetical protein
LKKHEGMYSSGVHIPQVDPALHFLASDLRDSWEDACENYLKSTDKKLFPFASVGTVDDDGIFFLVVDVEKPQLPVLLYDYEGEGLNQCAPSFDAFLKGLSEDPIDEEDDEDE